MNINILKRLSLLKSSRYQDQLTYGSQRQFSSIKETLTSLIKGKTQDEEEQQIIISPTEYKMLNLNSNSSIKSSYLQYKKHGKIMITKRKKYLIYVYLQNIVNFYHPNVYKGKDGEEKLMMLNEVYMKIIKQRIQNYEVLTEEDRMETKLTSILKILLLILKKELEMLEKSNFGVINYETKTVTDQLIEYDDKRYEWEPTEPKHYVLFLFSSWVFLGVVTLSMEKW